MSDAVKVKVGCPSCKHEQEMTIWRSINITLNPELKQKLFSGEIMRLTCEQCGQASPVAYPMLYHDMDRQFMCWLIPDGGLPEGDARVHILEMNTRNFRFRVVRDRNELLEKAMLLEAGIDDRMMETYKLAMRNSPDGNAWAPGTLLFFNQIVPGERGKQNMIFVKVTPAETTGVAVDEQHFRDFERKMDPVIRPLIASDTEWLRVDEEYAREQLARLAQL